jgi:hypothetical protein
MVRIAFITCCQRKGEESDCTRPEYVLRYIPRRQWSPKVTINGNNHTHVYSRSVKEVLPVSTGVKLFKGLYVFLLATRNRALVVSPITMFTHASRTTHLLQVQGRTDGDNARFRSQRTYALMIFIAHRDGIIRKNRVFPHPP